jgi:hypothetical protein
VLAHGAAGVFLNLDGAITEGSRFNALMFDRWRPA